MTSKTGKQQDANDILAKGGLTNDQIATARLKNTAERMAWDMFLAHLMIAKGIEQLQLLLPDVPQDTIKKWAAGTLKAARLELEKAKTRR